MYNSQKFEECYIKSICGKSVSYVSTKTHDTNICKRIRHLPSREFTPMFNKPPSNWSHGREPELACQSFCFKKKQQIDWHRTVPWKRLDTTIFLDTPLATSQLQKTPHSIKFSHEDTETEPNTYDLWIKQINLLQYNARSKSAPCIQFHHKPIFLRKVHQGADFCRDSGPFLHPLRPNDWRACVFSSREQLLDVLSMCLIYS